MATQLQIRRGTAAQVAAFTGAEGEIVYNSTNDSLHTNDGATAGGFELARADLNNVSDANLNAALTGNTLSALTITTLTATGGTINGTVIGGTTAAAGSFTTGAFSGEIAANGGIALGDGDYATFGASDDLQIYHDGSNSYITESGTGNLQIQGQNLSLEDSTGTRFFLGIQGGETRIYNQGNEKVAVTATGIDVTGTVTAGVGRFTAQSLANSAASLVLGHEGSSKSQIRAYGINAGTIGSLEFMVSAADGTGSKSMTLNASGNVGIDNSNPSNYSAVGASRLVVGTNVGSNGITIVGATTGYSSLAFADSAGSGGNDDYAGLIQYSHITNGMNFFTNSTQKMVLDASGKILIGDSVSQTADLLQIETPASGGGHGIQIRRNDSNTDQGVGRIQFGNNTATDLASISAKTDGAADNGALLFNTSVSGGANTERLRINSIGNVGISTSSPAAPLSFGANIPSDGQTIHTYQSGNTRSGLGIVAGAHRMFTNTGSALSFGQVSTTDGSTYTEAMRISGSNVGIGRTPNSVVRLAVAGVDAGSSNYAFEATNSSYATKFIVRNDGYSSFFKSDNSASMIVTENGNLLVGVSTGSSRLQVRGSGSASIFAFETEQPATAIYGAAATLAVASGENLTNAMLYLRKDSGTSRSINAAGTVNASGADYAEYERNGGLSIAKGSIVGFTADGVLTLTFSEAVRFAVKSTDPSYVGGDTWGTEAQVGAKPNNPTRIEDESDADFESREAEYETDLATFEEALEAARQLVDRIAYSGKVPVNVQGAIAGDYIIAVAADDGSIDGQAVSDPDFSQYKLSVGRVNRILDDGRAEVAVIIH